jgi:glycosyltransferase involved in cell wall biosynthesis
VVGARIGGIPELVRDGETGCTFEAGNAADLRAKVERLLAEPEAAADMGRRARGWVERELSPERHYEGLMSIYEEAGRARA